MLRCNATRVRDGILADYVMMKPKTTLYHAEIPEICCACFAIPLRPSAKFARCVMFKLLAIIVLFANYGIMILENRFTTVTTVVSADLVKALGKTFFIAKPVRLVCPSRPKAHTSASRKVPSVTVQSVGSTCSRRINRLHSCGAATVFTSRALRIGAIQATNVPSAPRVLPTWRANSED